MKMINRLLVLGLLSLLPLRAGYPSFAARPNALSEVLSCWIMQDEEMVALFSPYDTSYFEGEIDQLQLLVALTKEWGMGWQSNYDTKVWVEDAILSMSSPYQDELLVETGSNYEYYRGNVDVTYDVLTLMNNWPGTGAPVPGTTNPWTD